MIEKRGATPKRFDCAGVLRVQPFEPLRQLQRLDFRASCPCDASSRSPPIFTEQQDEVGRSPDASAQRRCIVPGGLASANQVLRALLTTRSSRCPTERINTCRSLRTTTSVMYATARYLNENRYIFNSTRSAKSLVSDVRYRRYVNSCVSNNTHSLADCALN